MLWELEVCYFWQVPRSSAEPRRFVFVFDGQMGVQMAVVNLDGKNNMASPMVCAY